MTLRRRDLLPNNPPPDRGRELPASLYRFIWRATGRLQIGLCLLTGLVVALETVPLELQRRMVDGAIASGDLAGLYGLGAAYLGVLLVQGGIKYVTNVLRGRAVEEGNRVLRALVYRHSRHGAGHRSPESGGALVSIIASEVEDIGAFAGEGVSTPLQQGGTALAVFGYLLWVEPLIAGLALLIYLPQWVVVPRLQHVINAYSRTHAKVLRLLGEHMVREEEAPRGEGARRMFRQLVDAAYGLRMRNYMLKYLQTFTNNFLEALAPLMVLVVGGWMVIQGQAEAGTLVVFISGFQRIADPGRELINFYRLVSNAIMKYRLIRGRLEAIGPPVPEQG